MKYLLFFLIVFSAFVDSINAQLLLPNGSKFIVTTQTDNLLEYTVMDQHMQVHSDATVQNKIEIISQRKEGFSLRLTPEHFFSTVLVNGRDQKIDTDSLTDKNNPIYSKIFELLHQPQIIDVKGNTITKNVQLGVFNQSGLPEDPFRYFLNLNKNQLKLGSQWADSIVETQSKISNQYFIIALSDSTITVNVNTDFSFQNQVEQNGTQVLQQLKGFNAATRTYKRNNLLLLTEKAETDISGNTETPEMSMPITMKIKSKTKLLFE